MRIRKGSNRVLEQHLDLPFDNKGISKDDLPYYPDYSVGTLTLDYLESPNNLFLGEHDTWDSYGGKIKLSKGNSRIELSVRSIRVDSTRGHGEVIKGRGTRGYKRLHHGHFLKTFDPSKITIYSDTPVKCDSSLGFQTKFLILLLEPQTPAKLYCNVQGDDIEWESNWILISIENSSEQKKLLDFLS